MNWRFIYDINIYESKAILYYMCKNYLRLEATNGGGNVIKLMGFSVKKKDISLHNIVRSFETSGWIFFTQTNIMYQILSRNDVLKKIVGCIRDSFKKTFKFLFIKSCIYDTYRIDFTSNPTQRLKYQYFSSTDLNIFLYE